MRKYSPQRNARFSPVRQRGAISIFAVILLLSILGAATITPLRGAIFDQRMSSNEYQYSDALHAAEAGLDYAVAWAGDNTITGFSTDSSDSNYELAISADTNFTFDGGKGSYAITTSFRRHTSEPSIVRVTSISQLMGDDNVTASVQQFVQTRRLTQPDIGEAPPIMIDGCLDRVKGNPKIEPKTDPDPEKRVAIASSQSASCVEQGNFDLNGGRIKGDYFTTGSLWDQLFAVSRDDMKAAAAEEINAAVADADRQILWVGPASEMHADGVTPYDNVSSDNWHSSVGSPARPVILVFDQQAGCPKINGGGGVNIYGVVFFEASCGSGGFGWGNANIYGTVAFTSDVKKINANTKFSAWEHAGGGAEPAYPVQAAYRFHGTWTDLPQ